MARRSPQEKKTLSYAKDRRNDYGENDKSSRKSIRRNKRVPNRLTGTASTRSWRSPLVSGFLMRPSNGLRRSCWPKGRCG